MKKVLVPVLNRTTYGRLKSVLKAIHEHPKLELQIVLGASFFDAEIEFPVLYRVQCLADGDSTATMSLTISRWMEQFANIVENFKPDLVYVHADRHENWGTALVASCQNRIICHGEGGDVTSSIDDRVRRCISQLADYHFPVTEQSKERLIRQGCDASKIFVVGSTALDTLNGIDLANNYKEPYILIVFHPNTVSPESVEPLIDAIKQIPIYKRWIAPNIDPGSMAILKKIHREQIEFIKNLVPEEYARLIYNAECLVGNSSSFIKEAGYLGVPAVLIGNRQQGREVGRNVLRVPNDWDEITVGILKQLSHGRYEPDYRFGEGTAARKIVDILAEVEL
jgi:UDP-hydrolysing UDP-N-acetyl-D-glucosamine 2-epimerase